VELGGQKFADRLLATCLMVGGVVGVVGVLFMGGNLIRQHWIYGVLLALFVWIFVWSALSGLRLWRGKAGGWKWATILFAAQIPVLTVPGMTYEYYTGLSYKVMGGHVTENIALALGSQAKLYLDTRITDLAYGVNLFACAAAIYLFCRRNAYVRPSLLPKSEVS